jgi:protein-tyrosine phosphatase
MASQPIHVVFLCMGNICRSPMAEAIFRHQVAAAGLSDRIRVSSAGTGDWHSGELPHRGTLGVLQKAGIAIDGLRARQISAAQLADADVILAMDRRNIADLRMIDRAAADRSELMLSYGAGWEIDEVPDPYYTGNFDVVYAMLEQSCARLLQRLRERHGWLD